MAAGTPPAPTINYLAVWLFEMAAGVDVTVVTYKGTAPLTNDVLGNHVPLGFDTIPAAVSNVQAGQLRAIAVTRAGPPRRRCPRYRRPPMSGPARIWMPVLYYGLTAPRRGTTADRRSPQQGPAHDAGGRRFQEPPYLRQRRTIRPSRARLNNTRKISKREEGKWAALVTQHGLKIE